MTVKHRVFCNFAVLLALVLACGHAGAGVVSTEVTQDDTSQDLAEVIPGTGAPTEIRVGVHPAGATWDDWDSSDTQFAGFHAVGVLLDDVSGNPNDIYRITFDYDFNTFDQYLTGDFPSQLKDNFGVNANPEGDFLYNLPDDPSNTWNDDPVSTWDDDWDDGDGDDDEWPGVTWSWGGETADANLKTNSATDFWIDVPGDFQHLTFFLSTGLSPDTDAQYPSWGNFTNITIEETTGPAPAITPEPAASVVLLVALLAVTAGRGKRK
jgi:hypothetical protein